MRMMAIFISWNSTARRRFRRVYKPSDFVQAVVYTRHHTTDLFTAIPAVAVG